MLECSEWHCHQIWPWISTSLRSAQQVFIGSGYCDVFDDHWIQSQRRRWSMSSFSSHIDYCNILLAGAPKATTDKLQRLLNVAARLVSDTKKTIAVQGRLCMSTLIGSTCRILRKCLHHKAPRYLMDYCIPISDVASRRYLCSAGRHYLVVPRQISTQLVWASGFCCCRPNCLELTERWSAWSDA